MKKTKYEPYMLLPLLPIISIGVFCLRYGQNIFQYYLPNSQWNDEIIYYKTIEGIVKYGMPQGYFGYNESHALIGTFGAWSPFIYLIDAIWGSILGWNLYSPIFARIFFAVFSMVIFAVVCKPNMKKTLFIYLFMIGFALYSRHLVSQMSDCYFVSLMIIFAGFYEKKDEKKHIKASMVLIVLLTLMRPYYVLLWLLIYDNKSEIRHRFVQFFLATISMIAYLVISKYYTAQYFKSLINIEWIIMIFTNPLEGIINLFNIIKDAIRVVYHSILNALTIGSEIGSQYLLFCILTIIFIGLYITKKDNRNKWCTLVIVNVVFWFAIVLLYDVGAGSRHLMPFIIFEGFVLINCDFQSYIEKSILIVATCYICMIKLTSSHNMTYPVYNKQLEDQIKEIRIELDDAIDIDRTNKWNNTVLWVFSDIDGEYPWQTLYGLPAGMGINICTFDYMIKNIDNLNAGYIACTANGEVSYKCKINGWKAVYKRDDKNTCIYQKE